MTETPEITQTVAQPVAVIRLTIPRADIQKVMGPGLAELRAVIAAQGVTSAGPWFTHHLKMAPDVFDFEIGVPVATPVANAGRVKAGEWPAMNVARTIYQGGFGGLGAAWREFDAWIVASGHTPGPDLWERYLAGPESSPDPASWRTELTRPIY